MAMHARPPNALQKSPNMRDSWKTWKDEFVIFMKASGYIRDTDENKANLLMNLIGRVGMEAMQNFVFDDPTDKDNMDILLMKFDAHFDPPKNETEERYQFFTRCKKINESIEEYINAMKMKAKSCNFGDQVDNLIRDKVVLDTKDKLLRKMYFEQKDLNLEKVVRIYKTHELSMEKMAQYTKERSQAEAEKSQPAVACAPPVSLPTGRSCWRCGRQHPPKNCPAFTFKCNMCGEVGHFNGKCRKRQTSVDRSKLDKNLAGPFHQIDKGSKYFYRSMSESLNTGLPPPVYMQAPPPYDDSTVNSSQAMSRAVSHDWPTKTEKTTDAAVKTNYSSAPVLSEPEQPSTSTNSQPVTTSTTQNTSCRAQRNPTPEYNIPAPQRQQSQQPIAEHWHEPTPRIRQRSHRSRSRNETRNDTDCVVL